jgi:hypothetical protein
MLQAYLDGMSQLLTDEARPLHRAHLGDSLSTVARARTLTVLTRLEGECKGSVVRFLYESGLITKDRLILDLRGANLSEATLYAAVLRGANLIRATLSKAMLFSSSLRNADLRNAIVTGEQLAQALSFEGATMSNGQKYEDWLKDKEGRGEDVENSGPS